MDKYKIDEGSWTNIENNETITGLKDGDTVYARLTDGTNHGDYASVTIAKPIAEPGKEYDTDTDIEIGGYPVTIPGGATISKIPGEYESVEDGIVIYITNGNTIKDWSKVVEIQETYDQFVWVPVDKKVAIIEEGKDIIGNTNTQKYNSLKSYVSKNNKYPMAVKKEDGTYSGILYDFKEGNDTVTITPKNYTLKSDHREPSSCKNDINNDFIDEEYFQSEYKLMIEQVASQGGFWVGRYETTNMHNIDFTTNAVNVVRYAIDGISDINWYQMYKGQKEYKNATENTILKNSGTTSSMIWGSQWDQIMIWMRDVKNIEYPESHYIVYSLFMGNYGGENTDGEFVGVLNNTGTGEEYKVKNIYDLAGNVEEATLECYSDNTNVTRGGSFYFTLIETFYPSWRSTYIKDIGIGSRLVLY